MKSFKIQLVHELKSNDLPQRRIFGEWAHGKLGEDPLSYRRIVFSDEAHFWLNKQNCRFWSEDQPEQLQKLPIHTYLKRHPYIELGLAIFFLSCGACKPDLERPTN